MVRPCGAFHPAVARAGFSPGGKRGTSVAMETLEISLDGYTDLPPGKIANVVTYLETFAKPPRLAEPARPDLVFRRVAAPDVAWYRETIRTIGEEWLWYSPLVMPEDRLAAIIRHPDMAIHVLERDGETVGVAELDRRIAGQVELSFFGVAASEIGTGAARLLMNRALDAAFAPGIGRVWVHTCTFDHPAAVRFYRRAGFSPYKFAIEVTDDPRLTGHVPETAGPHVALIRRR
jgi:GNAT superfamily N-acetyltransferase